MQNKYDITIAGLPIGALDRTTPETLRAFKRARVIMDLTSNPRLFRRFCKNVINLDNEYWTGELDEDIYKRIANLVLNEARKGAGVVLVADGHPAIYQDLSWDVYDRGRRLGLRVQILPALSCFDLMIAFCRLPMDARGLQIVEATSIVAFNSPLNPFIDTFVMQIGWFGTSLISDSAENKKGRFEPLAEYLMRYYPPSHIVKIIRAPYAPGEPPKTISTQISSLDRYHKSITTDMTMFIPALTSDDQDLPNEDFIRQTTSEKHLARIAR